MIHHASWKLAPWINAREQLGSLLAFVFCNNEIYILTKIKLSEPENHGVAQEMPWACSTEFDQGYGIEALPDQSGKGKKISQSGISMLFQFFCQSVVEQTCQSSILYSQEN